MHAVLLKGAANRGLGMTLRLRCRRCRTDSGSESPPSTRPAQPKSFSIVSWSSEAPLVVEAGEKQILFALVGIDRQSREGKEATLPAQRLDHMNRVGWFVTSKTNPGRGCR